MDGQRDCVSRIRASLEQADQKAACLLAHTLKSTAGQIGATALFSPAETLEAALRRSTPATDLEPLLAAVGDALFCLVESIEPCLARTAEASADGSSGLDTADSTQFAEKCAELERRLAADDFCCLQLMEQNAGLFKVALDGSGARAGMTALA